MGTSRTRRVGRARRLLEGAGVTAASLAVALVALHPLPLGPGGPGLAASVSYPDGPGLDAPNGVIGPANTASDEVDFTNRGSRAIERVVLTVTATGTLASDLLVSAASCPRAWRAPGACPLGARTVLPLGPVGRSAAVDLPGRLGRGATVHLRLAVRTATAVAPGATVAVHTNFSYS